MMSSKRNREKWLLLSLTNGSNIVISLDSVISPINDTKVGTVVIVDKGNGSHEAATVIGFSRDRELLERQISRKAEPVKEDPGLREKENEEPEDYSPSGSSWAPSDDNISSDEEIEKKSELLVQRYSKNRRLIKPSHSADAVLAALAKKQKMSEGTERKNAYNITDKKSLPDSTRKNNSPAPNHNSEIVSINVQDIIDMRKCFQELLNIIRDIKLSTKNSQNNSMQNNITPTVKHEVNNTLNDDVDTESAGSDRSRSEDLNRSDDNVLITNKYKNNTSNNKKILAEQDTNQKKLSEWIPIGSGKTLIHKDKYRKVKWKSYTVATRTLLLAVFPRRILGTHSLTGKPSPAFQEKPAKMCLDPKIVTDVIIEITERFKVKESQVRSVITTKCADECKMLKMRQRRRSQPAQLAKYDDKKSTKREEDVNMTF